MKSAIDLAIEELAVDPRDHFWHQNDWISSRSIVQNLFGNLDTIFELLGGQIGEDQPPANPFHPEPPIILVTKRINCCKCNQDTRQSLRRHEKPQKVWVLSAELVWKQAHLFIAHCPRCRSDYYPDRVTFQDLNGVRVQQLEIEADYLRISKHGVWANRRVAYAQEKAVLRFHAGWSNFADWVNDTVLHRSKKLTLRQSKRLFIEHFSRRLLVLHGKAQAFECGANISVDDLASEVRDLVGANGGSIDSTFEHSCRNCTHAKRYPSDLQNAGWEIGLNDGQAPEGRATGVAELDQVGDLEQEPIQKLMQVVNQSQDESRNNLPADMPRRPLQQPEPLPGAPRGYVRLAVMDGKMIGHRICAMDECQNPLVNYRNGRFCRDHAQLNNICGIIPCGAPVARQGSVTCARPEHVQWYKQYQSRFQRLSFPGVQRVMRRQSEIRSGRSQEGGGMHVNLDIAGALPALDGIPGDEVTHTFRARSVYCIQTVQWACGMPIGWGKCYRSESSPQVLSILDALWAGKDDKRPSFLAYDNACDLLRHIVTQNPQNSWLTTTKFIVDAWHYIGHRATDALCRLWCNPAPLDGSQPDLILIQEDDQGQMHATRAFNTETAEQLNSWLNRYEPQLRQMSDVTFDFFVHVLMLLYKESVEERIERKGESLPNDFWDTVI
ncbi:hypothetical protein CC1G_14682 [Coprinopsis cinerea okayama7|uniref:CxC5 like cysteine cluster associated with KDZ domain-containing protein n=1 Tax=Coprinopsis cinerea (strain Okayama-7 / 130 / ATCC MYA-4618 / FGSC 9003) TaxID=240176 RepID=D6RMZ7_COPC7|nr:hypothetical protein CC1G_14682 [Coprinopsis cinerea okayama7\|eukprot:XP_002911253.1 hypothetical protein CC1G_14682 [Coprinopsis cinerea okayama7\